MYIISILEYCNSYIFMNFINLDQWFMIHSHHWPADGLFVIYLWAVNFVKVAHCIKISMLLSLKSFSKSEHLQLKCEGS